MKTLLYISIFAFICSFTQKSPKTIKTGLYRTYFQDEINDSSAVPSFNIFKSNGTGSFWLGDDECRLGIERFTWEIQGPFLVLHNSYAAWRETCKEELVEESAYRQYFRILKHTKNEIVLRLERNVYKDYDENYSEDEQEKYFLKYISK